MRLDPRRWRWEAFAAVHLAAMPLTHVPTVEGFAAYVALVVSLVLVNSLMSSQMVDAREAAPAPCAGVTVESRCVPFHDYDCAVVAAVIIIIVQERGDTTTPHI